MDIKRFLMISILCLSPAIHALEPYESYDTNSPEWNSQIGQLKQRIAQDESILKNSTSPEEKALASLRLGVYYMSIKDGKSVGYLTQAAQYHDWHINSPASYNLGMVYLHGKGVPINLEQSFKWFAAAAKKSNTEAMREIFIMCRDNEVSVNSLKDLAQWAVQAKKKPKESITYIAGEQLRQGLGLCPITQNVINGR